MTATQKLDNTDMKHGLFRKTKLCSFFLEGRCRHGEQCTFAHGEVDVNFLPDLTKTSLCVAWKAGTCHLSAKSCRFAHGKHELRSVLPIMKRHSQENGECMPDQLIAMPPGLHPYDFGPETLYPFPVGLPPGPLVRPSAQTPANREVIKVSDLEPMKVKPPSRSRSPLDFEPMKVPSSLFRESSGAVAMTSPSAAKGSLYTPWDQWEHETVLGDTSSDDNDFLSWSPLQASPVHSQHELAAWSSVSPQHHKVGMNPVSPVFTPGSREFGENFKGTEDRMSVAAKSAVTPKLFEFTIFDIDLDPIDEPAMVKGTTNKMPAIKRSYPIDPYPTTKPTEDYGLTYSPIDWGMSPFW